jgi:hypothetical protein
MNILLAKGQSQYEGTRTFTDHAAAAFIAQGHSAFVLDLVPMQVTFDNIVQAAAAHGPYDLIFTINYLGETRNAEGRYLSEVLGAPHVVWHTDYILSQQQRLEATAQSTPILVVDPTQIDAIKSIYGEARFDHLGFFPHPAVGQPAPEDADVKAFEANRPIPILWSGGFQRPGTPPWNDGAPATRKIFNDAFDLAMSVEWMAPHIALETVARSRGADMNQPGNREARKAAWLIDREVRMARRFEFIRRLAKTGLPVYICGVGWDSQLYRFKNVQYAGSVSMSRMVELMRESRIVLNTNGNFGGGSHERPFSALLAGAACFTDYSQYYGEVFEDGADVAMFRWKSLGEDLGKLEALHADPQASFAMAQRGKVKVIENHTWTKRIEIVLAAAASAQVATAA